jgi:hypothetical protein
LIHPIGWHSILPSALPCGWVRRIVDKDDLSPAERKAIKALIARVEQEFGSGAIK